MADATTGSSSSFGAESDGSEATSHRAKQAAEDALNDLKGRAAEYLELGRDRAVALTDVVEDQIRQRPVPAVAVAAGIGFALGFFWTRRS